MARKEYLTTEERSRLESPPQLSSDQKGMFLQIPEWGLQPKSQEKLYHLVFEAHRKNRSGKFVRYCHQQTNFVRVPKGEPVELVD